jgi:hypothetical protein
MLFKLYELQNYINAVSLLIKYYASLFQQLYYEYVQNYRHYWIRFRLFVEVNARLDLDQVVIMSPILRIRLRHQKSV